jgi:hypothetical protein
MGDHTDGMPLGDYNWHNRQRQFLADSPRAIRGLVG